MTSASCIFCRIIRGEIKGDILDRDDHAIALRDIHPQAPVHVLIIPTRHIAYVKDADDADRDLLGRLVLMANRVAAREGLGERGYRLVINYGPDSQNSVPHLHVHVLGGRPMSSEMA
jgi:histidine triad (HIT) family protein